MEFYRKYFHDIRKPLLLRDGKTTTQRLVNVCKASRTKYHRHPSHHNKNIDCDEVYPGVYVGNGITARNKGYLQRLGVTHVLNAAEGRHFGIVDTNKAFYKDTGIKYLGIPLTDLITPDNKNFFVAADFIEEGVALGGKVFVHCVQGVSRSAACAIAYLMIKRGMTAEDAIRRVRANRNVQPTEGLLSQLAKLDNQLRKFSYTKYYYVKPNRPTESLYCRLAAMDRDLQGGLHRELREYRSFRGYSRRYLI